MPLIFVGDAEAVDWLDSWRTIAQVLLLTMLRPELVGVGLVVCVVGRGVLKPEQSESSSPEAAGVWNPRTVLVAVIALVSVDRMVDRIL